jgi:hypothetical protein
MKLIPLTNGMFAKVDDGDFDLVSRFKWRAAKAAPVNAPYYAVTTVRKSGKRTTLRMHRLIMGEPNAQFDHADGDGLNNQRANLRPCDRFQNGQNRKIQQHSSPFKGVTWYGPSQKYVVKINIRGRQKFLGYFSDPLDGALVYDATAIEHFGPFARTNQQMGAYK